MVVLAPISSGPASCPLSSLSRVSSSAESPRMRSAYYWTTTPAGVSEILPWPRSNSRVL